MAGERSLRLLSFAELSPDQRRQCASLRPNWTFGMLEAHKYQVLADGSVGKLCMPVADSLAAALGEGTVSKHDIVGRYHSAVMHFAPERKP